MQGNNWDKIIEDKLKNLDVPYTAGTWDALEKRMNHADRANEKFDDAMRKRLSDIDLNYQPTYWEMLAQRLEEEASLRNHFIRYKASEVLLVFLLLITFVQFFPSKSTDRTTTTLSTIASNDTNEKYEEDQNAISFTPSNILTEKASLIPIPPKSGGLVQQETSANALIATEKQEDSDILVLPINTVEEFLYKVENAEFYVEHIDVAAIPTAQLSPLAIAKGDILTLPISLPKATTKTLQIGMFASSNVDHIQTPYEEIFDLKPASRLNLGYSGGVSLTWSSDNDRVAWETALIYTHKEYTPANRAALFTSRANNLNVEALKDIELDIVQIPVYLNYYVKPASTSSKWKVYVSGGGALNLTVDADYYVGKISATSLSIRNGNVLEDQFEFEDWQLNKFEQNATTSNADPESKVLKEKGLSSGLFNKGSLKENTYFTVSGGVGIEYILNERHTIYGQPTYRKHLNFSKIRGIGPDNDRINGLELIVGVKTYLKQ